MLEMLLVAIGSAKLQEACNFAPPTTNFRRQPRICQNAIDFYLLLNFCASALCAFFTFFICHLQQFQSMHIHLLIYANITYNLIAADSSEKLEIYFIIKIANCTTCSADVSKFLLKLQTAV